MHDILCSSWLVDFLGFETEFQSILGRLIGDMEVLQCVSYPFLLFLIRIWCVSAAKALIILHRCAGRTIFWRKLVWTVVTLYAEVGQKLFIRQCRPNQTANTQAV